jgi:hypothetical protein
MRLAAIGMTLGLGLGIGACHHDPPPDPAKAEAVGTRMPAGATLTSTDNKQVALADLVGAHAQTVVVFYRGYF